MVRHVSLGHRTYPFVPAELSIAWDVAWRSASGFPEPLSGLRAQGHLVTFSDRVVGRKTFSCASLSVINLLEGWASSLRGHPNTWHDVWAN